VWSTFGHARDILLHSYLPRIFLLLW
jgi:hypothetical protein